MPSQLLVDSKKEIVSEFFYGNHISHDGTMYTSDSVGRPARTYFDQLAADGGGLPEDLPELMEERDEWNKGNKHFRDTLCITLAVS